MVVVDVVLCEWLAAGADPGATTGAAAIVGDVKADDAGDADSLFFSSEVGQ